MTDPTKIGIWRTLGDLRVRNLLWPEGFFAVVIGVGGTIWVVNKTHVTSRVSATGNMLAVSGALLAVVFTALALVVSLPLGNYLRMLAKTGGGMKQFLDPFLTAAGAQIAVILLSLAYQLAATSIPAGVEHVWFGVISFVFVFGVLDLASLARQLVLHGIARAEDAEISEQEKAASEQVRRIDDRRR